MSGKRVSVAVRLSIVLVSCITVLLLVAGFGLSRFLTDKLEQKSLDALQANNQMIIDMIDGYNRALEQTVQRLAKVFAGNYADPFTLDPISGELKTGALTISPLNTLIPDRFTKLAGTPATVLTRKGEDFIRTSTSIANEKGERAAGVPLGVNHPAVSRLLKGESYTGKAKMLGRDFMTHYIPILDATGQVVGAFFVGLDFTEGLADLKKKMLAVKVGDSGYAYALDAGSDAGRVMVHPASEGEMLLGTRDASGQDFVKDMLDKRNGIIRYGWQAPGESAVREKVVAFNHYPEWHWLIASGTYIEEFNREAKQAGLGVMLVTALLAPVVFLIVWFATRRWISAPLNKAVELVSLVAEGDFRARVEIKSNDEIGALLSAQAGMVDRLGRTISEVRAAAATVASDATQLTAAAGRVAESSNEQSDAASSMAAAVEQVSTSIDMVAQHAAEAMNISNDSQQVSQDSAETIRLAVVAMNNIANTVRDSSAAMTQLGHESRQISTIADSIKEIAGQTNLLALNAAIEAARAGESGRGFAVVADEVRKLAERTTQSTHEIAGMIGRIQQGTQLAVDNMNVGVDQVSSGVELAAAAGEAIDRIRRASVQVSEAVSGISSAIREQSAATTSVAQGLEKIANMTERNSADAQEAAHAAEALQVVATRLRGTVEVFKL